MQQTPSHHTHPRERGRERGGRQREREIDSPRGYTLDSLRKHLVCIYIFTWVTPKFTTCREWEAACIIHR